MSTIGTSYVQILPSAKGMRANIQKEMGGDVATAGQQSGKLFTAGMLKTMGVVAIGAAVTKAVTEGAKLEQSLGGVETLYKQHADIVIQNANKAWSTAGLSANDYMEQSTKFAASLLQSLGGDTKAAAKYADMAIIDMSDNANKMGTNIEDIQNAYQGFSKQNYTMLDNLKLGYGGTKSEMERLLSDAEKISGQKYDISNLNDVYDAIHVVQGELGITGTTAKEASETLSGSFSSMKSAATNFLGALALGKNVEQTFGELVTAADTFLMGNLLPTLQKIVKSVPKIVIAALTKGVPAIIKALPKLVKMILNSATSIFNQFATYIEKFTAKLGSDPKVTAGIMKSGLKIMKSLGTALVKGIAALSQAVVRLQVAFARMFLKMGQQAASKLVSGIKSKIGNIGSAIRGKFSSVYSAITSPFTKAVSAVRGAINKIKSAVNKVKMKLSLKVPKISVSGGKAPWGIGGKGKKPSFNVKWAAKGGIVDGATLIGAGEKGAEAIVPLDPFWNKLSNGFASFENKLASMQHGNGGGNVTVVMQLDGKTIGQSSVEYINGQTIQFGASPLNV